MLALSLARAQLQAQVLTQAMGVTFRGIEETHPTQWTGQQVIEWWAAAAPVAAKHAPEGTFGAINASNTRVPPPPRCFTQRGGANGTRWSWSRQRFVRGYWRAGASGKRCMRGLRMQLKLFASCAQLAQMPSFLVAGVLFSQ